MNININTEAGRMVEILLRTFETALKHANDGELKNNSKYLHLMQKICEVKYESLCREKALDAAKKALDDVDDDEAIDADTIYDEEFVKCVSKCDMKQNVEYTEFKKHIAQLASPLTEPTENGDFVVEKSEVNVLDPLTKLKLTDPVRNTNCGHHYERSTILECIANNNRCRCPVPACGNQSFITTKSLVDDNVFKRRLKVMAENDKDMIID